MNLTAALLAATLSTCPTAALVQRQRPVERPVAETVLRPVLAIPVGSWAPKYRCNLILLVEQRKGIPAEFWTAVGAKDGALPVDVRILAADGSEARRLTVRVPLAGTLNYPLPPLEGPHTVIVLLRPGLHQWGMVSVIDNTSNDPTSVFGVATLLEVER